MSQPFLFPGLPRLWKFREPPQMVRDVLKAVETDTEFQQQL